MSCIFMGLTNGLWLRKISRDLNAYTVKLMQNAGLLLSVPNGSIRAPDQNQFLFPYYLQPLLINLPVVSSNDEQTPSSLYPPGQ
jgi:hypothetical protein